jgi:hypothetical protein
MKLRFEQAFLAALASRKLTAMTISEAFLPVLK